MHETGPRYEQLFAQLGAAQVATMDFDTRRDCQEAGRLRRLEEATGIFFTGGNQLRLTTLLGGTPVAKMIRARNAAAWRSAAPAPEPAS
jgi:cyanophycinase